MGAIIPKTFKAPPPSVHFAFTKDQKTPKGFSSLSVGQEVTVTVTGKVSSLNEDAYGAGFTLDNFTVSFPKSPGLRRIG